MKASTWILSMATAVALVAALAVWDARRERGVAEEELGDAQAEVAKGAAAAIAARLSATQRDALAIARDLDAANATSNARAADVRLRVTIAPRGALPIGDPENGRTIALAFPLDEARRVEAEITSAQLLTGLATIERPRSTVVLVQRPNRLGLMTTRGAIVHAPELEAAIEARRPWIAVPARDAEDLGLEPSRAIAGLAAIDSGTLGRWGVAVVTADTHLREREARASLRAMIAVALAIALAALGATALRVRA